MNAMAVADKTDHEALLKFWLAEGFKFRMKSSPEMQANPKAYKQRMVSEFNVIRSIDGYIDYFLLTSDLIRWAKNQGILVGAGRGSAAGSLCCWFLRITEVDPLMYPMLFERFISVDRTDLPDIDIDFEDERRTEVIRYTQEKYGYDKVANILNFVRYQGRNSLDDIARVYKLPEGVVAKIKDRLIERSDGHPRYEHTIIDTVESFEELEGTFERNPDLLYATRLQGNYRNTSFHPAGVIIASTPLNKVCATYEKQSGTEKGSGVAYDKKDSEYLGLLKVDFLSLTTLTGVRATLDHITRPALEKFDFIYSETEDLPTKGFSKAAQEQNDQVGMSIDEFYRIPLDDPKVYEAFRKGDMLGIFQFEGYATRRVLKAVQPTKFMDLVDVNALSRPGGDDAAYIKAKTTGVLPKPIHPNVDKHIEWTYGTIVYQEQILLILRDLGNFGAAEVNAIRKIISAKQDNTVFNEYLARFIEGAATHGVSEEDAKFVWQKMINATGYAFNISHAVCYADLAYRQMWLKVHHPEFYLGQLLKCPTTEIGLERRRKLIVEAERKGIRVLPPSLQHSRQNWTLVDGKLYAGWLAIKGIGPSMANGIIEWKDNNHSEQQVLWDTNLVNWDDLLEVPGIGPGRVATIREFCENDDPFGVMRTQRLLDEIRDEFDRGSFGDLDAPTHNSLQITGEDDGFVVHMGVLKKRVYKDTVQQRMKYGGDNLTREQILDELEEPELIKYCTLTVEDEFDEPIQIRVSRKKFPEFQNLIAQARIGVDVILAKGYVSEFGGLAIQAADVVVIEP